MFFNKNKYKLRIVRYEKYIIHRKYIFPRRGLDLRTSLGPNN